MSSIKRPYPILPTKEKQEAIDYVLAGRNKKDRPVNVTVPRFLLKDGSKEIIGWETSRTSKNLRIKYTERTSDVGVYFYSTELVHYEELVVQFSCGYWSESPTTRKWVNNFIFWTTDSYRFRIYQRDWTVYIRDSINKVDYFYKPFKLSYSGELLTRLTIAKEY